MGGGHQKCKLAMSENRPALPSLGGGAHAPLAIPVPADLNNTSVLSEIPSVVNASASILTAGAKTANETVVAGPVGGAKVTERERGRVRHKAQALLSTTTGASTQGGSTRQT